MREFIFQDSIQEVEMIGRMSHIARTNKLKTFWRSVSLVTQQILDATRRSLDKNGALVDFIKNQLLFKMTDTNRRCSVTGSREHMHVFCSVHVINLAEFQHNNNSNNNNNNNTVNNNNSNMISNSMINPNNSNSKLNCITNQNANSYDYNSNKLNDNHYGYRTQDDQKNNCVKQKTQRNIRAAIVYARLYTCCWLGAMMYVTNNSSYECGYPKEYCNCTTITSAPAPTNFDTTSTTAVTGTATTRGTDNTWLFESIECYYDDTWHCKSDSLDTLNKLMILGGIINDAFGEFIVLFLKLALSLCIVVGITTNLFLYFTEYLQCEDRDDSPFAVDGQTISVRKRVLLAAAVE